MIANDKAIADAVVVVEPAYARERVWSRCRWPHRRYLTSDDKRALNVRVAEYRPYIERKARALAYVNGRYDAALEDDLEQAGVILLWELGPERIDDLGPKYMRAALRGRMRMARRTELRAAGWKKRSPTPVDEEGGWDEEEEGPAWALTNRSFRRSWAFWKWGDRIAERQNRRRKGS
jgi:hypothetical protein